MTTIINPSGTSDSGGSSAGWAIAVILLLAIIGGGMYYWSRHRATNSGTNINVTLPTSGGSNP